MTTMKVASAKPISAAEPEASMPVATDTVSLKAICTELKLDPRLTREKLLIAVRKAKKCPELAMACKPRSACE